MLDSNENPETWRIPLILWSLLLSALVHLLCFNFLKLQQTDPLAKVRQTNIEIEYDSPKELTALPHLSTPTKSISSATKAAGKGKLQKQDKTHLAQFIPKYQFQGRTKAKGTSQVIENSNPHASSDPYAEGGAHDFMNSMGIEQATDLLPFFQNIWQNVDSHFDYPDEFIGQRVQGTVNIHIEVDESGLFNGNVLHLESTHEVLQTYALVILMDALKEPLHESKRAPTGIYPLAFSFQFKLQSDSSKPSFSDNRFAKNNFLFQRTSYVTPKFLEKYEDLVRYVPPIVPIPGGVIVDFVGLYKFIRDFNEEPNSVKRARRLKLFANRLKSRIHRDLQSHTKGSLAQEAADSQVL